MNGGSRARASTGGDARFLFPFFLLLPSATERREFSCGAAGGGEGAAQRTTPLGFGTKVDPGESARVRWETMKRP